MDMELFLEYVQSIITMVDPDNKVSFLLAKNCYDNLIALMTESEMCPYELERIIVGDRCTNIFNYFVRNRERFASIQGFPEENWAKRIEMSRYFRVGC